MYKYIVEKKIVLGVAYKVTTFLIDDEVVKCTYEPIAGIDFKAQQNLFESLKSLGEQNLNFFNQL
jgi:hypothetical protein